MQMRTRPAQWMDRIFGSLLLLGISFLWFATRLGKLIPAALLAIVFTALVMYGLVLTAKRFSHRKIHQELRARELQAALYALTMLPYDEALPHCIQALCDAYELTRLFAVGRTHFLADPPGHRIAVQLHQSPQHVSVADVHEFHKERKTAHGALICVSGVTADANEYAQTLVPPLKIIQAKDLPLPEALTQTAPAKEAQKQRKASVMTLVLHPAQALRYMMLSFMLIVAFILTDRAACLIPALIMVFLALISKRRNAPKDELF